jgi:hypothetical protein
MRILARMVIAVSLTEISAAVAAGALCAGIVGTLAGVFNAVREYRLKSEAQRHQIEAQQATRDVELARLFAELVPIANGRGPAVTSENAVAALFAREPDR